ncbi:glucokinase [Nocardia sp. ET3-3]|uniref:Glucokinase n=1 Tax=Nocardia terrae TaxID=2675851 RepID=A0A7K1V809_9NOCA|nr:glucokinase [Nocardia terrae]MVU82599.1 glucokinase [Nocardia terrae]
MAAPAVAETRLVADIGGTNARFGLTTGARSEPQEVRILRSNDYPDLVTAIEDYLSRIPDLETPVAACVAVAGPVDGDRVRLTNARWDISIADTRERLGFQHFEVINDLAALALAVPQLPSSAFVPIGAGIRRADRPLAVIGPGTGLGVAGLIRHRRSWIPLPGEGGQAALPIDTDREAEVARVLRQEHGTVCAETVLSGPGLTRLHAALCLVDGIARPSMRAEWLCESARRGCDSTARETLEMFCGMLGAFAAGIALTLGATGGVLLGGFLPDIADILSASAFRRRFVGIRAVPGYLDHVATDLIVASTPALRGAAHRLAQHRSPEDHA